METVTDAGRSDGIAARAAEKEATWFWSSSDVSVIGRLRVKFAFSLMHESLQICHFALAVRVNESPGVMDVPGSISIRNTGDPL